MRRRRPRYQSHKTNRQNFFLHASANSPQRKAALDAVSSSVTRASQLTSSAPTAVSAGVADCNCAVSKDVAIFRSWSSRFLIFSHCCDAINLVSAVVRSKAVVFECSCSSRFLKPRSSNAAQSQDHPAYQLQTLPLQVLRSAERQTRVGNSL